MTVPLRAPDFRTASEIAFEATHCTSRSIVRRILVPFLAETISDCDPGISAPAARAYE